MIAVDTSTWIAFFQGDPGRDAKFLDQALQDRQVVMPPAVLDRAAERAESWTASSRRRSWKLPLLEVTEGYWQRAGALRAQVLAKRRKARLGDALIAQSCMSITGSSS